MKHISFELYNKFFNVSHVSLVLEKHASIETLNVSSLNQVPRAPLFLQKRAVGTRLSQSESD